MGKQMSQTRRFEPFTSLTRILLSTEGGPTADLPSPHRPQYDWHIQAVQISSGAFADGTWNRPVHRTSTHARGLNPRNISYYLRQGYCPGPTIDPTRPPFAPLGTVLQSWVGVP